MTRPAVPWRLCSTAILSLVSTNTFHRNEAFIVDSWRVGSSSSPTLLRQVQRRGTRPSSLDAHQSRSRTFAGSATCRAWGQRGPALLTGERFSTTARMSTGQQVEKEVETIGAEMSASAGEDVTGKISPSIIAQLNLFLGYHRSQSHLTSTDDSNTLRLAYLGISLLIFLLFQSAMAKGARYS